MPKICPCQKDMKNDNYLFTILIIDLVLGFPELFGALLAFIGLMITLKQDGYKSGYFNFYAWYRMISCYVNVIALVIYCIIAFFLSTQLSLNNQRYFSSIFIIVTISLMIPFMLWYFYTSYQFFDALEAEQKDEVLDNIQQDLEAQGEEQSVDKADKNSLEILEQDQVEKISEKN